MELQWRTELYIQLTFLIWNHQQLHSVVHGILSCFQQVRKILFCVSVEIVHKQGLEISSSMQLLLRCILAVFVVEVACKMLALGRIQYFKSGWNTFDFYSAGLPVIGFLSLQMWPQFYYVVIFRPLKMFRLFKIKKRYRDIIGTVALLSPLIKSALIVMLVVYYFFAIIGMELFGGYDMRDCCK